MPKFFRNIRIKSIELSKVKNYLLYAVGEIILVAIGILLALQVSNWNEERNNDVKRKKYYDALVKDLRADTQDINFLVNYWQTQLDSLTQLKKELATEYNLDTLLVKLAAGQIIVRPITEFTNTTYNTLVVSGDMRLIDDSVQQKLKQLIVTESKFIPVMNNIGQAAANEDIKAREYFMEVPGIYFTSFINNRLALQYLYNSESKTQALRHLNQALSGYLVAFQSSIHFSTLILEEQRKLIFQINELKLRQYK